MVMDVIKNDKGTNIGTNIRRIRLESKISQTDLVRILQLKAIKTALGTSYEELLE